MNITELSYPKNSANLFAPFANWPYAIWLDSCQPKDNNARFDIMAAAPEQVIQDNGLMDQADPLTQVQNALKALPTYSNDHPVLKELPFKYGAIGYLAYDLGRRWHALPALAKADIPLPHAIIGIYSWSITVNHLNKKAYLICAFDQEDARYANIMAQLTKQPSPIEDFHLTTDFQSNMSKADYTAAFHTLKHHIREGDCYQANLCQRFSATFEGSPWQAYQRLREHNPTPFAGYFNFPEGCILSLSPERFLKVTEGWVETKPIKGTSARHADPKQDRASATWLMNSEKDKAENLMIVDLLRNDLGKSCVPGSIKVPTLFGLESFPNVHHLVSTITGQLQPNQHALDLLRHAFPGGSITGAPKLSAMQIVEKLEPHRRAIYCGSLLYLDVNGNLDTSITIRTLICEQNRIHCYAGGGIVADSECDSEYEETFIKIRKLMGILAPDQTTGH